MHDGKSTVFENLKQSLSVEKLLQTIRNNTHWLVNIWDQTTVLLYYSQDLLSLISYIRNLWRNTGEINTLQ